MATQKVLTISQQQPTKIWPFYSGISQKSDHYFFTVVTHKDLIILNRQLTNSDHLTMATLKDLTIWQWQLKKFWPFYRSNPQRSDHFTEASHKDLTALQLGMSTFCFFVIKQFLFYCPSEKKLRFVSFLFEIQKQKKHF